MQYERNELPFSVGDLEEGNKLLANLLSWPGPYFSWRYVIAVVHDHNSGRIGVCGAYIIICFVSQLFVIFSVVHTILHTPGENHLFVVFLFFM